nr:hypothetical protein CFP56_75947 [Quercus suber]
MEARGRYARLCIQLDITKPLINIVLIGRFEQPVVYEGIHRLCFSYGRIWHRLEACPLTIKKPEMPTKGGLIGCGVEKNMNQGAYQRGMHDSYSTSTGSGTSKDRIVGTGDDGYGPWMLVALRKPGQKKTNLTANTKDHTGHGLGQSMHGLRQEPKRVIGVKGKRVLARSRVTKLMSKPGVGNLTSNINLGGTYLGKGGDGECADDLFQFTASGRTEVGVQARRLLALPEVQSSDQACASTQQACRGERVDSRDVGVADGSVSKEGKFKGEDGIVGMEFEAWILYKEPKWITAILWIILLVCFGSITTCAYILMQLLKVPSEENLQDPMSYVLLRHPGKYVCKFTGSDTVML